MKQTVNEFMFMEAFKDMGRADNFTPEALRSLFAFLEEMERDTGEESELDVIAICCDFSQESYDDIMAHHGISQDDIGVDSDATFDEEQEAVKEWLDGETIVVDYFDDGTILYLNF